MYAATIHSGGIAVRFDIHFARRNTETTQFSIQSVSVLNNNGVVIAIAEDVSREALIEAKRIIAHYLTLK